MGLKNSYENYWKSLNRINTSIKIPLTVSINSNDHKKIKFIDGLEAILTIIKYKFFITK